MHTPQEARDLSDPSTDSGHRPVLALLRLSGLALAVSGLVGLSATGAVDATAQTQQQLSVRGVMRASAQASISTDLAARVAKVGFKEGERFRAGDVLVA